MRLYSGSVGEFITDTTHNTISDQLRQAFQEYYGRSVNTGEMHSWINSLQFLKNVLERYSPMENMVVLEYELPYTTQRIDCLLFGKGEDEKDNCVVIELKQWEKVKDSEIDENVITYVGGAERMIPHPSFQVRGYHYYLQDFVEMFHEETALSSCVYCHNYSADGNGILFLPKFQPILDEFPLFTKNDFGKLGDYITKRLSRGQGLELFNRFLTSRIAPSKKLIECTSDMVLGQKIFNLLDEQITANNTIIDRAKKCAKLKNKSVIIISGGPGTGKSVIALNALAELLSKGLMVYHATGSAAFTRTLRKIAGARAANLFRYFNSFSNHRENEIDVLICDEAHRIRKTSNYRFTKKENRSSTAQIEELIKTAKVSVFFIDEFQVVRPEEIGSIGLIKETAAGHSADVYEFELKTQFRCSGSDGYLNWIDNTLMVRETANRVLTRNDKMEFRIFRSTYELFEEIKRKNIEKPNSARLVAGFCWPWSDPNPDGTLKEDVVIGDFRMPWEGKDGKKLAPGIPPAPLWAYDRNGVNQIGCIYTIQGFEFEYVGVIFGKDLMYDPVDKTWKGYPKNSADQSIKKKTNDHFLEHVKGIYRVLLTRGMKGCYVHFLDKGTEDFFRSRIEAVRE
jgi:uncharacterized protein